ncbi:MAG: type IV-A pilus assembly ATPase PilB, partial [Burkholderiales bacterium]|nr:type IV-A pilus assembly ATPase PilB [Burkholderiales bacterium]
MQSSLTGLGRSLVQKGRLRELEAETLQSQAASAQMSFAEQLILSKKMNARELAEFAAYTFGFPLFDLNAFDPDHLPKKLLDSKVMQTRRVLPLYKRGNRLFLGVSDPSNRTTLEDIKFQT